MYTRECHTFGDTWYFVRGEEVHLSDPYPVIADETGVHVRIA